MPNGQDAVRELDRAAALLMSGRRTVFIAFDLEWWERDNRMPLEIGWASRSFNCGCDCGHYKGYVDDNKDDFQFAQSDYMYKRDAFYEFEQLVKRAGRGRLPCGCTAAYPCDVVLVGHALGHDLAMLEQQGCDIHPRVHLLDMQLVAWGLKNLYGEGAGRMKLETILDWMEIDEYEDRFLHNAGNDAWYTLEALLALIDKAEEACFVTRPY